MDLARQAGGTRVREDAIEEQVARGFYFRQLQRAFAQFGADRVLVLQYERCRADYERQLDRTYAFLDLEPGFRPKGEWNPPHAPAPSSFAQSTRGRALTEAYAADAAQLAEHTPDVDLTLWPSVRDLV
jgi:hypothetical protein